MLPQSSQTYSLAQLTAERPSGQQSRNHSAQTCLYADNTTTSTTAGDTTYETPKNRFSSRGYNASPRLVKAMGPSGQSAQQLSIKAVGRPSFERGCRRPSARHWSLAC